jgi:hypothetical protein
MFKAFGLSYLNKNKMVITKHKNIIIMGVRTITYYTIYNTIQYIATVSVNRKTADTRRCIRESQGVSRIRD